MKKAIYIIVAVLIFTLAACVSKDKTMSRSPTYTQTPTITTPTITPSPTANVTSKIQFFALNRAKLFIAALATNDKELAESMISYPFYMEFDSGYLTINNRMEFYNLYEKFFTTEFINDFINLDFEENMMGALVGEIAIYGNSNSLFVNLSGNIVSAINRNASLSDTGITPTKTPIWIPDPNNCYDTAMSTYDLNMCGASERKKAAAALESLIDELQTAVKPEEYQNLLDNQEEWELFASDYCGWYYNFFITGTIRGIMGSQCMVNQYEERINDLRLYLCQDNGLSGECEVSLRYKPD